MGAPQQFSLKWNNYSQHIVTAFEDLRGDDDLTDVTLSCDGKRIKAHKVLLSACSVYFKETFRENPCKHPVVILKGVSFADLQAVVTFMYNGQVNVSQERLNSFLQTAELLQIKGLTDMNDQEEPPSTKKRSHSVSSGDPVITNVAHSKNNSDDSSIITPEIVTSPRPPTPKRKRIGPASFMQQQQQLLSQHNDSQVPSSNVSGSSNNLGISSNSSTNAASGAGPSSVSSSTGGLLNPETVILPSTSMMDSGSNSGENFSHGIIKFEEEEVLDEDDDYEKNNLSEDNDSSMHDMLGGVEQEQNSLGTYIAGTSGQQPIKILTGGQDTSVHVTTRAGGNEQQQREEVDVKPPQLKQKVTKTSNRFLKATETKRIIPKNPLALESEPKETIEMKKEGVVPPLKQIIKKEGATAAGAVDISANGRPEVGDKNEAKTGGEAEKCLSDEDCKAEQIRIRFEQEEFMSRLDLLRNPPPNVPITLPSLRPIPKLQRGSQSLSAAGTTTATTNSSSGSARNFSGSGLGHNLSFSTPNFSISQQLLRSAKATARAKDARSLSLSGGLNTRNTSSSSASSKLSNAVGKGILHGAAAAAAASTSSNTKALVPKAKVIIKEDLGGLNNALGDSGGPFVCDLCGKRYVHHRSLNDHKKFHTGATTCQYCNKAFSKVANLRAHILAQHKDNGHDGYLQM